jgi:glutathione synthase/RimK-type ligase-like ATP-grasp enzyme
MQKIPRLDALFIRALTDPMNATYVASRIASLHGIPVIDDPHSIRVCSDKINMYMHLMKQNVPVPRTKFLHRKDMNLETIARLLDELGSPLVLKEPSTSFSVRVEQASTAPEILKIARRYLKLSDWIVVQEYIESRFDWRIGVLDGRFLYACRYIIPSETFKIEASVNGHIVYCTVESVAAEQVPPRVIALGIAAGKAIGKGLYGVDIKENNGTSYVIEVNDNPSLEAGEDDRYPDVYTNIVGLLMKDGGDGGYDTPSPRGPFPG